MADETKGADDNICDESFLASLVAQLNDVDSLRKTILDIPPAKRMDVISLGKHDGKTLMYHAVEQKCTSALQLLAEFVCDPNVKCTEKEFTCLHAAVILGEEHTCKILVNAFGNIDEADKEGKIPNEMHPTDPYGWGTKLKTLANNFKLWMQEQMTATIDIQEAQNFRRSFDFFDKSGDGLIQKSEMRQLLFSLVEDVPTEAELQKFYGWFDQDNDGMINWKEFLCAVVSGFQKDEKLRMKRKKRKGKKGKKKKGKRGKK